MRDVHGVDVPVPTPFRGDEVAVERLKSNLAKWNETPLSTLDGDGIEEIKRAWLRRDSSNQMHPKMYPWREGQ